MSAPMGAETVEGQYKSDGSYWSNFVHYPSNRHSIRWMTLIVSFFNEYIATFGFVFVTVWATKLVAPSASLLNGFVLGLVAGGAYYMFSGWQLPKRSIEYELPRHLSISITFAHWLGGRCGIKYAVFYWIFQILGSLTAGALLKGFGMGFTMTTFDTVPYLWGVEILASFFICFGSLYSNYFGIPESAEKAHTRSGQHHAAGARVLFTTLFLSKYFYSGDFVVYLGGLIGLCTSGGCPGDDPIFAAPVFYAFVPLIGAAGAGVIFFLLTLIHDATGRTTKSAVNSAIRDPSLQEELIPHNNVNTKKRAVK